MAIRLFFKDNASALLYKFELEGQISDGKYENSRPYDHWKWVTGAEIVVDPNCTPGHTGYDWRRRDKKYTLSEWPKYMRSGEEEWAWRTLNFIRFGSIFPSSQENFEMLNVWQLEYMLCRIPYDKIKEDGSEFTYDDFVAELKNSIAEVREQRDRTYGYWQKRAEEKSDPTIMDRFPEADYKVAIDKIEKIIGLFTEEKFNAFYSIGTDLKEWKRVHELMKATVNTQLRD